ncbi:MAG: hypothetical protein IJP67_01510 [Oscillospiraceae bacterium]|nr:hypothetical protein [Oscillospiraceae bacterium]
MSIESKIERLQTARESIKTAIRAKGVTVPQATKLDGLAVLIGSIETGTDTSDATASASDILSGRTAYGSSGKLTGTIASKAASDVTASENTVTVPAGYYAEAVTKTVGTKKTAQTYTPGTADQTIAAGRYLSGAQTIKGDADLVAANIRKDVSIFGVTGTYSGTDVSDTTATAADVLSPKKFHAADGTLETGTIATKTSSNVTASGATVTVPAGYYASQVQKSVAGGTAGTPTAVKGNVLNHSVTITPKVTNTTGYITGGEKSGTAVTVTASELVSGTKTITANGTGIDVSDYASVTVNVESTKPTLNAPSISLSGKTLTITNPATNGNFVAGYKIYSGQEVSGYVTSTTVDLSKYITESGAHTVTVKAYATGFNDSAASNSETYTVAQTYAVSVTCSTWADNEEPKNVCYVKFGSAPSSAADYDFVFGNDTSDSTLAYLTDKATGTTESIGDGGSWSKTYNTSDVYIWGTIYSSDARLYINNTEVPLSSCAWSAPIHREIDSISTFNLEIDVFQGSWD